MNHINTPQGTDLQNIKAKYIMDPSVTIYASCALFLRPFNGRCNGTPSTIQRKVQRNSSDHPTEGATELLRPSNGRCNGTPEVKSCEKGGLAGIKGGNRRLLVSPYGSPPSQDCWRRSNMSVEAVITVNYEGKQYQVEVCYNPGEFVIGVKELIVAKLKDTRSGPRVLSQVDVRVEDLILKTGVGDLIEGDEMPEGKKFSADLLVPAIEIERPLKRSKLALVEIEVKPAPLGEIEGSGFFFEASGLFYAGLATKESDKKRLFMRPASLKLVGLLRNLCDGDSPGMRIFGAPGVGKSCTVWAWACDECLSNDKKVLWVHVLAKGPPEDVVLMTGKKIYQVKCIAADIMSSDADIIVVDRVTNAGSHDKYSSELLTWGIWQEHRRWVQVASMQMKLNEQDEEAKNSCTLKCRHGHCRSILPLVMMMNFTTMYLACSKG